MPPAKKPAKKPAAPAPVRLLKARSVNVLDGKKIVTLMRGDEVPAEHVEYLDSIGALLPLDPSQIEEGAEAPAATLPALDAKELSVEDLAKAIAERELSTEDTVALAQGDKDLALKVFEAETAASGGSPREDVVTQLEALQA